jgi:hypothetical protein
MFWLFIIFSECRKLEILTNKKLEIRFHHPILIRQLAGQNKDRAEQCSSFS